MQGFNVPFQKGESEFAAAPMSLTESVDGKLAISNSGLAQPVIKRDGCGYL